MKIGEFGLGGQIWPPPLAPNVLKIARPEQG